MAFPSINPQNPHHSTSLSSKLDDLLHSCTLLESHSPSHQELTENFLFFQRNLETLKRSKNSANYSITSKKIEKYVKEKFKTKEIPVKEIMTSRLNSTKLSFEGFNEAETSKTLRKRKRKFAENWKEVYHSQEIVNVYEKNVENRKNEKKTATQLPRQSFLEGIIKDYMGKKLGLARKTAVDVFGGEIKTRVEGKALRSTTHVEQKQVQRRFSLARKSVVEGIRDEREYLDPGFKAWEKDTSKRLVLEKIIKEQHQKERRHQMVEGLQELRLMKYESMSTKYIA